MENHVNLRYAVAFSGVLFAAAMAGDAILAQPVTPSPAVPENAIEALEGLTGRDRPEEVIYARRLVMTMIGSRILPLSLMANPGAEFHPDIAEEALLTTTFLFDVFPHLFPPETNTMPPEDEPGNLFVTNARPTIWEDFDTFYERSRAAGAIASAGLRAREGEPFIEIITELQAACDACHANYRRTRSTYGIPIPPLD